MPSNSNGQLPPAVPTAVTAATGIVTGIVSPTTIGVPVVAPPLPAPVLPPAAVDRDKRPPRSPDPADGGVDFPRAGERRASAGSRNSKRASARATPRLPRDSPLIADPVLCTQVPGIEVAVASRGEAPAVALPARRGGRLPPLAVATSPRSSLGSVHPGVRSPAVSPGNPSPASRAHLSVWAKMSPHQPKSPRDLARYVSDTREAKAATAALLVAPQPDPWMSMALSPAGRRGVATKNENEAELKAMREYTQEMEELGTYLQDDVINNRGELAVTSVSGFADACAAMMGLQKAKRKFLALLKGRRGGGVAGAANAAVAQKREPWWLERQRTAIARRDGDRAGAPLRRSSGVVGRRGPSPLGVDWLERLQEQERDHITLVAADLGYQRMLHKFEGIQALLQRRLSAIVSGEEVGALPDDLLDLKSPDLRHSPDEEVAMKLPEPRLSPPREPRAAGRKPAQLPAMGCSSPRAEPEDPVNSFGLLGNGRGPATMGEGYLRQGKTAAWPGAAAPSLCPTFGTLTSFGCGGGAADPWAHGRGVPKAAALPAGLRRFGPEI